MFVTTAVPFKSKYCYIPFVDKGIVLITIKIIIFMYMFTCFYLSLPLKGNSAKTKNESISFAIASGTE